MTFAFYFSMDESVDSKDLWEKIKTEGVNVTDTGKEVWIHGEAPLATLLPVIDVCSRYGQVDGEIHLIRR